jgi:hypothetical protein
LNALVIRTRVEQRAAQHLREACARRRTVSASASELDKHEDDSCEVIRARRIEMRADPLRLARRRDASTNSADSIADPVAHPQP